MHRRKRYIIFFTGFMVLSLTIFFSCNKDDFDFNKLVVPELEGDGAVPLIHSSLQLNRILPRGSILVEDPVTGLVTLIYQKELISLKAEDYITIPEQQESYTKHNLDISVSPGVDLTMNFDQVLSFHPPESGQRIDSVFFKSAVIDLGFNSGINHNCSITVDLPTATKDGMPFHAVLQHNYDGNLPVTGTLQLDLSGYKINLNAGGGGTQVFPVHFAVTVLGDNNPNLSPYSITFNVKISQIRFSKIFGYLGQYEYPLSDSLELSIFSNNFSGSIQFEALKLFLTTFNSIGMPMQLNINEIKAYSTKNPPYMVDLIDNPSFPNPITFLSPDIYHVGDVVNTVTTFTTTNCNLNQALNISPKYIHFDFTGKSNPSGNPADENFLLDTSRFKVEARVELPFFGSISDFILSDTLNFTFTDIDYLEELSFIMVTLNRFPLNVGLQVWFTDEQFTRLDSLIYGDNYTMIQAAPVGGPPDYRIIEDPPPSPFIYHPQALTRQRLDRLGSCRKMIIYGELNTTNSGLVKIYGDYNLDVRLGARAKYKY